MTIAMRRPAEVIASSCIAAVVITDIGVRVGWFMTAKDEEDDTAHPHLYSFSKTDHEPQQGLNSSGKLREGQIRIHDPGSTVLVNWRFYRPRDG